MFKEIYKSRLGSSEGPFGSVLSLIADLSPKSKLTLVKETYNPYKTEWFNQPNWMSLKKRIFFSIEKSLVSKMYFDIKYLLSE